MSLITMSTDHEMVKLVSSDGVEIWCSKCRLISRSSKIEVLKVSSPKEKTLLCIPK